MGVRKIFTFKKSKKEAGVKRHLFGKRNNGRGDLFSLSQPSSFVSEQFRIIRTALLRLAKDRGTASILVTSALPQEGKTFIASNLAVSIARSVSNLILLIDGDLRNPSIHKVFGMSENKLGLSTILSTGISVSDVICETSMPNLSVVTSGPYLENQAESFFAEKMRHVIDEFKASHRGSFIIIDAGPAQLLAETSVMAEVVDGIVLVVKMGQTKRQLVNKTVELLGRDKVIGVILNYCDMPSNVYKRYYQYYSKDNRDVTTLSSSRKE
jgi:capsular exopolysaccharide synthesis family protein